MKYTINKIFLNNQTTKKNKRKTKTDNFLEVISQPKTISKIIMVKSTVNKNNLTSYKKVIWHIN